VTIPGAPGARRHVLVLGDVNVDLAIPVPDRSVPRGSRTVAEPRLTGGGTCGNVAAGLARLGVPVEFAGAVGDDGFGRWIAADFDALGVGRRGLVVLDRPTAQVIALLEPDGDRSLVVWPTDGGALTHLEPGHLDRSLIGGAAWLHTSGMGLREGPLRGTVLEGMRLARTAGILVSIDLNLRVELWGLDAGRRAAVEAAIELADVVLGNGEEELAAVAGVAGIEAALEALGTRGGGRRVVVARLGADGAIARDADGAIRRSPGFAVAARNAVGAGDAFDAGFIAASVDGRPLAEALRWGNAVAALKVARPGGARDLPDRAEVEALLAGT
jgi:sugar/nucleoside kinase (ribokinase family)